MITPQEFPYLSSVYINDCFAYQDFNIELVKHQPFSHLILTGKNGSGKSTILRSLDKHLSHLRINGNSVNEEVQKYKSWSQNSKSDSRVPDWNNTIVNFNQIIPVFENRILPQFFDKKKEVVYSFSDPTRKSKVSQVNTPTKQDDLERTFLENSSPHFLISNFKQYLVNKKVNQAFAQLKNKQVEIEQTDFFFKQIEAIFAEILEDKNLQFVFIQESYDFIFLLGDGRKITFDTLPDGFSAFFSILIDLFLRVEVIRKNVNDFFYNPCGIVLIDEPETHLHLSLQYQVLPTLTALFPNIQFIVATHSPAIISSIPNVTIFDLTTKETRSDDAIASSFSELMVSHFGLDNEFSSFTDAIFEEVNMILKQNRDNIPQRNEAIKRILAKNERFISPTMRFELEAKIAVV